MKRTVGMANRAPDNAAQKRRGKENSVKTLMLNEKLKLLLDGMKSAAHRYHPGRRICMKSLLVVPFALMFSCTGVLVNLPKNELKTKSLGIATFLNCKIRYSGDVRNEFGDGDQDILIRNYLQTSIVKGMERQSCFNTVKECDYHGLVQPGLDSLRNIRRYIRYLATSARSKSFSCDSDILLLIDNVKVYSSIIVTLDFTQNVITNSLRFTCAYAYWSAANGSVLARGNIDMEVFTSKPGIEMSTWTNLTDGVVNKLLVESVYARQVRETIP